MKIVKYLLTLLFVGKLTDAFVAPNTGIIGNVKTALQSTNYERAMRSGYGGTGYGSSYDNNSNGYYGNSISRSSYNMDRYGSNSYDRGYGSNYGYGRGYNNYNNNNRYGNSYGYGNSMQRYGNNDYGGYGQGYNNYYDRGNNRGGNMRLEADGLPSFHELYQEQDYERQSRRYGGESYYNNRDGGYGGSGGYGRSNYGYNNRYGGEDYGGYGGRSNYGYNNRNSYNNNGFNSYSNGNGYGRGYGSGYNNNYSSGNGGYGGRYGNSYNR